MERRSFSATNRSRAVVLTIAAIVIAACAFAQDQPGGSLADAARQARAQKTQASNASQAQAIADELSDDQNDTGAPGGFKTFNAGDYQLWVPAPYHMDGHDDAGVVLSGPMVGVKHPIVLVGSPVAIHSQGNSDDAFADMASKFARLYAQTVHCEKAKVANYPAYQCSLAGGTLLGTHVSGNAVFVEAAGTVYPVFCTAPSDSSNRDYMNDHIWRGSKEWSAKQLAREEDDARSVFQKCDTVFSSIHLKPQAAQQQTAQAASAKSVAAPPAQAASAKTEQPKTDQLSSAMPASQAPVQTQSSQAAPSPAAPGSTIPSGFKVHAFTYCKTQTDCFNASVLVPAEAQLVSSSCKQYVFESKVQGTSFLLMAGLAKGECNGQGGPDLVRWNQLADPESKRAPGTYSTISSLNTTVDGKPAVITTMSFRKGLESWMGKRAELESNGIPLVVGCMAPRDHFADGDTVCSTLIGSLQLP